MNTLRKSYSVGDVSADNNPVHRRAGRGAVLQALDEHDRAPSRTQNQVQSALNSSVRLDDSDTEEFDELFEEMGEELEEGRIGQTDDFFIY